MTCFNLFKPKVYVLSLIIVSLRHTEISARKTCSANEIQLEHLGKKRNWIDEKGLLKYDAEDPFPKKCESCPHLSKLITEGSEVCYTAVTDYKENTTEDSICNWTENISDAPTRRAIGFKTFSFITGLKVLSVTKYKIEKWLHIDETFAGLTDLEYLYLESNHITGWNSTENKEPLTNLRVLSLANNPIANLSEKSFTWLHGSKLEFLNLRGCSHMKILDSNVINPLKASINLWLDLSYTIIEPQELENLTAGFKNSSLLVLSLAHAGFNKIPTEALKSVAHSLKKLSLQGNYFSNCWSSLQDESGIENGDCSFPNMPNLTEINLKDSGLTDFPFEAVLKSAKKLKILYLDENPLQEISSSEISDITHLYLRNIKSDKQFLLCVNGCAFPSLKILDLSNTVVNVVLSNFSDLSSLQNLSLRNSINEKLGDLLKPLNNLKVLDLSYNNFGHSILNESFQGLKSLEILILKSSSIYISSTLPPPSLQLSNLKVLDMRDNYIRILNKSFFKGLKNLQKLFLCENKIGSWNEPVFQFYKKLEILDLQSNWLSDITDAMILDLRKIANIDISGNPLSCKCCLLAKLVEKCISKEYDSMENCNNTDININLLNWSKLQKYECPTQESDQKLLSQVKASDVCKTSSTSETPTTITTTTTTTSITTPAASTSLTMNMTTTPTSTSSLTQPTSNSSSTTPKSSMTTSYGSSSESSTEKPSMSFTEKYFLWIFLSVILIGSFIVYCRKYWNFIMCLRVFKKKIVLTLLKDPNTKKNKEINYKYDVFLSYSDRDREWILQQLIPNIEQRSNIKVCLHERDFQAGLPVLENIMACMDHSRCVLLVLSEAFLRSHWCQFELNLAQHRLLEMQNDRLILVLLENIPRDKCSKMLRYLMLTKTYLFWPVKGTEEENNLFWRKLKKAIGPVHNTVNVSFV